MKKYIGYICITISIGLIIYLAFVNSRLKNTKQVFSAYSLLESSWIQYKNNFITPEGRVIDKTQDNITTSEGQSYALLRAVWMDDRETFQKIWSFTQNNLKRPKDNLFGWKWGKTETSYGFMKDGGENSASDASSDIALALILASNRWENTQYKEEALRILADHWSIETSVINNKRYVIAGNWASSDTQVIINPSYIAPYAYRVFSKVDKQHDWNSLIDPAYELLNTTSESNLNTEKSAGLPPDWIAIDKRTGDIKAPEIPQLTTNYSYDAIRTPWRIAVDYSWSKDQKALAYLKKLSFLNDTFSQQNKLLAGYSHDGKPIAEYESPAMYATALGYFTVINKEAAAKIYQEKIIELYSSDSYTFKQDLPYYEQNWLWFGAALYHSRIIEYEEK